MAQATHPVHGRTRGAMLTDGEWHGGYVERPGIAMNAAEDGAIYLMQTHTDGRVDEVRIDASDRPTLAALALRGTDIAFRWDDHDDEVITAVLLGHYRSGVPYDRLSPSLRAALEGVLARRGALARRIATLLPPRSVRAAVPGASGPGATGPGASGPRATGARASGPGATGAGATGPGATDPTGNGDAPT